MSHIIIVVIIVFTSHGHHFLIAAAHSIYLKKNIIKLKKKRSIAFLSYCLSLRSPFLYSFLRRLFLYVISVVDFKSSVFFILLSFQLFLIAKTKFYVSDVMKFDKHIYTKNKGKERATYTVEGHTHLHTKVTRIW